MLHGSETLMAMKRKRLKKISRANRGADMPAQRVKVKAVEGRVVRTSPSGDFIPSDRFVSVPHTSYIDRLINFHEDLIVEPEVAPAAPAPVKETK